MTRNSFRTARPAGNAARLADPIPPESLTATADLAIRAALALMPVSALAWLFIAF